MMLNPDQKSHRGKSAIERFLSCIKITKDSGNCWEWIGYKNPDGYGRMSFNGKMPRTHRFIYEYFNGSITNGLELDHTCKNRFCANPKHLEAVTHKENILRGTSFASLNSIKTHCPKGHEYSLANTYHHPTGSRQCRTCHRDYEGKRRYRLNQKMKLCMLTRNNNTTL